jgi:hypothetical protein
MLFCDLRKCLPCLLVLEGMQQGDGAIEIPGYVFRTRSFKLNRANFLIGQGMMMSFICPARADQKEQSGNKSQK